MRNKNEYALRRRTGDRVVTLAIFKTKEEAFDQRVNVLKHIVEAFAPNKIVATREWDKEHSGDSVVLCVTTPEGTKACYGIETVTDRTNK